MEHQHEYTMPMPRIIIALLRSLRKLQSRIRTVAPAAGRRSTRRSARAAGRRPRWPPGHACGNDRTRTTALDRNRTPGRRAQSADGGRRLAAPRKEENNMRQKLTFGPDPIAV